MPHSARFRFLAVLALLSSATPSPAAEGNFLIGYGTRQKALAGADVADSRDPMALSVNPAGIVGMARQWQLGGSLLFPERGYSAYGQTRTLVPGDVRSGRPVFPVPHNASVSPIDADTAWGMVSYGNGGINTAYSVGYARSPIIAHAGPFSVVSSPSLGGPFGGGFAGFDLKQSFISVAFARRFGAVTIGVAPTFAVQMLNIQGLANYIPYSANPGAVTDNGYDWSFGGGLRIGLEWRITDGFRFGLGAQTPMFMSAFAKYAGAIEGGGRLDIPAAVQAGFAYDVTPDVTLMADWRHIFYAAVSAIGNPSAPVTVGVLGAPGGPGFGWRDTDAVGFGAEWRATKSLTLRTGYRHSSNPVPWTSISLNVLGPAVSAHHVSGGFGYQLTKNSTIDFAAVYAFKNSISGFEALPTGQAYFPAPVGYVSQLPTYNTNSVVTGWLRGYELSASWTYKFDPEDTSLFPTHL